MLFCSSFLSFLLSYFFSDELHFCTHPHPGPLGCGPPLCHKNPTLKPCQRFYICDDHDHCQYNPDAAANGHCDKLCHDFHDFYEGGGGGGGGAYHSQIKSRDEGMRRESQCDTLRIACTRYLLILKRFCVISKLYCRRRRR